MSDRKQKILHELQLKAYAEGMSPSAAAAEWIIKLQDALREALSCGIDLPVIFDTDDPDYGLGEDDET